MLNMLQRGKVWISSHVLTPPSLPQTIKLAVYLPASWFATMGFPSESVSQGPAILQSGHSVDAYTGKSQLLSDSGQGGAKNLRRARLGRAIDLRVANEIPNGPTQGNLSWKEQFKPPVPSARMSFELCVTSGGGIYESLWTV